MRKIILYVIVGVMLLALGYSAGETAADEQTVAATATALPTPEPTEQPEPTPRIEVVEVEVEVVPEACTEAIRLADAVISGNAEFVIDVLSAYTDYPDETLIDFGRRFEDLVAAYDVDAMTTRWEDYEAQRTACLDAS